jgi:hypothetical protein
VYAPGVSDDLKRPARNDPIADAGNLRDRLGRCSGRYRRANDSDSTYGADGLLCRPVPVLSYQLIGRRPEIARCPHPGEILRTCPRARRCRQTRHLHANHGPKAANSRLANELRFGKANANKLNSYHRHRGRTDADTGAVPPSSGLDVEQKTVGGHNRPGSKDSQLR